MLIRASKLRDFRLKKIIWCFCVDIDATKTSLIVSANRNTTNRLFNLFRTLIWYHQKEEFQRVIAGEAECDEAYFGGKRRRGVPGKRGRGSSKQPVFGIFERNGRVYTEIVPNCRKPTLQQIIRGKISPETVVYTDKWRGYDGLVDVGYDKHCRINHSEEFSDGWGNHINGIENFWSFTKRRLAKFNGVKVNFELHLKESEWRYKKTKEQMSKELVVLLNESRQKVFS
jgi:transposase